MNWILLLIFIILECLDVYTTHSIISHGGYETKAVSKYFIDKLGLIPGLFAVKIPLTLFWIIGTYYFGSQPLWPFGLLACCLYYAYGLYLNYKEMQKQ